MLLVKWRISLQRGLERKKPTPLLLILQARIEKSLHVCQHHSILNQLLRYFRPCSPPIPNQDRHLRWPYLACAGAVKISWYQKQLQQAISIGLHMRVSHVGTGRQSAVETVQSADTAKTTDSFVCMGMESVTGSRSKFWCGCVLLGQAIANAMGMQTIR